MIYSVEDRSEMIKLFFVNNDSARVEAALFNERHPEKKMYSLLTLCKGFSSLLHECCCRIIISTYLQIN